MRFSYLADTALRRRDEGTAMPDIPAECQPIVDQIGDLEAEISAYKADLQRASTGQKPFLASQIKRQNRQVRNLRQSLARCNEQFGGPVAPPPLSVTFTSTVTITPDSPNAAGVGVDGVIITFVFDGARSSFFVTDFPDITVGPIPTLFGDNYATFSKIGGGSGIYATNGHMSLPLVLHLDNSLDLPFVEEDSDLRASLSTALPGGSPVTTNGSVTMVGTGTFEGGRLNGSGASIVMEGTLSGSVG
jgi:hypothetical protein